MGKSELINPESNDRSRWPAEARICEKIWNLTLKLRVSNLMQEYLENKLSLDDIDILLHDRDNSNMIQDIIDLKHECSKMNWEPDPEQKSSLQNSYFKVIADLGTVLAKSPWWERYQTITETMGVTCVLSIRTAESLFKRDPFAKDIQKELMLLSKQEI